jgi:hypothetical protein
LAVSGSTTCHRKIGMNLTEFNSLYDYKYDPEGRDVWFVIKLNEQGAYRGDCEDYSLSVLYYVICQGSWLKFWWLLFTFQAELCGCDTKNGGHAVLRYGDMYIDNWTKAWVEREDMEELGHKFWPWHLTILPTTVAIKMGLGKIRG